MRFLPAILAKLFPLDPPMDASPDRRDAAGSTIVRDPIAHELGAAVEAHARMASAQRDDYAALTRAAIDDLLQRIGKTP